MRTSWPARARRRRHQLEPERLEAQIDLRVTGGNNATGGATGSGGADRWRGRGRDRRQHGNRWDRNGRPGSYALNPPKQCDNQFFVQGCQNGNASSTCGGVSRRRTPRGSSQKPGADVGFLPAVRARVDPMAQAAVDDFGASPPFNYAIVGHDVDQNGLDGSARSACCQCYQLVYSYPRTKRR